ncbi:MAG: polyribonucleotide nucleotidyltransferase, partial [Candidatus Omnitrophica bacterium]|nr:polyribonucleotide nucleotidyltransferase [Candidatus Omnitrophota bacterium]
YHEVQVTASVLSSDKEHNSDVLAVIGASAAILIAGIPFISPVASARIGEADGQFILNPTFKELEQSPLDMVVAATEQGIIMIEGGANQVPEERVLQALEFAARELKPVLELQRELAKDCAKPPLPAVIKTVSEDLKEKVCRLCASEIGAINRTQKTKEGRDEAITRLQQKAVTELVVEGSAVTEADVKQAFEEIEKDEVRKFIVENRIRTDGRRYDEIRPITCEIGILPRTHGSALFTRGQTQSLGVATLGTTRDEQIIDALEGDIFKAFMLHYNFPPFSVGEIKPLRGPGRREIGHGALAERSLKAVMPSKEEFPYTVRLVSDILESNGSSSMASVCSGTLALMDAGVPVKAPVSGIAMGLVKYKDKTAVLSDIAGVEDHLGDMDFKVAGTQAGVTAIQLDLKLKESIDIPTLAKAFQQAKEGRLFILEKMLSVIHMPHKELSTFAPRITTLRIDPDKIREVIGPGGKVIRKITADSGATIEVSDEGIVSIASSDVECSQKALEMIQAITQEAEVGKVYKAVVKRIVNFGAFCEIFPGKEGLLHISEIADSYVDRVEDVLKVGEEVTVKVIEIDSQGRTNLSRKQLLPRDASVSPKRGEKSHSPNQKKPWS